MALLRTFDQQTPMPMAKLFHLKLVSAKRGLVSVRAHPGDEHYSPLGSVQGGFAATVLDIALGLASISVLEGDATGVATAELSVRYLRPISAATGEMDAIASVLHVGRLVVVAEATLSDALGKNYALAQFTSIILMPQP